MTILKLLFFPFSPLFFPIPLSVGYQVTFPTQYAYFSPWKTHDAKPMTHDIMLLQVTGP